MEEGGDLLTQTTEQTRRVEAMLNLYKQPNIEQMHCLSQVWTSNKIHHKRN
jgi:hypothetical protein